MQGPDRAWHLPFSLPLWLWEAGIAQQDQFAYVTDCDARSFMGNTGYLIKKFKYEF